MTINFRLLDYKNEIEAAKLKYLHNVLFPSMNASKRWFEWYFQNIFNNRIRVYSAWDSDKLIGIWCVEPRLFIDDFSEKIQVGRCFAVGIHPDYRRQNLFVNLSLYAISQERDYFKEYSYICGFPQSGKPVVDAHIKSGWDFVQTIDIFSYKPNIVKSLPDLDVHIQSINSFDDLTEQTLTGGFFETRQYKNLRWLQHPNLRYFIFSIQKNQYITIKPYANYCHILDFVGNDMNLIESAKTLTTKFGWSEMTTWCAHNNTSYDLFLNAGFQSNHNSIEFLTININSAQAFKLKKCHIQMGIEEMY